MGVFSAFFQDRTLRNKLRKYKKLDCPKKDCRAKFTSFLGYKSHVVTCGKSAEEREKFPCEFCGKVYFSLPGMKYHVKTVHTVQEVWSSTKQPDMYFCVLGELWALLVLLCLYT